MLTHISIRNFQSLHNVSVELKSFTVIVGPSSSGKSAFTRALKTLTSNQRGTSFITHGEQQCVIKATTDNGTVALLRGKKDEYIILPEDNPELKQVWTKMNGRTPEEVSAFIGIPAGDSLNYADQFDMPYLLKSSAGDVARTLGELTNVSVLFEASREANRRRLQASGTLKTRARDYEDLTKNLERFRTLTEETKKLEDVEASLDKLKADQTRILRLEQVLESITNIPDVPEKKNIPDLTTLLQLEKSLQRLAGLITAIDEASDQFRDADDAEFYYAVQARDAQELYVQELRRLGTCPTCGQDTAHAH